MKVKTTLSGSTNKMTNFLKKAKDSDYTSIIRSYAEAGAIALSSNTPMKTGKTANSWGYEIRVTKNKTRVYWTNDNMAENGTPVVILLEYGHGTKTGGFVRGRNFIAPAIRPIMDKIAENIWKEVTK